MTQQAVDDPKRDQDQNQRGRRRQTPDCVSSNNAINPKKTNAVPCKSSHFSIDHESQRLVRFHSPSSARRGPAHILGSTPLVLRCSAIEPFWYVHLDTIIPLLGYPMPTTPPTPSQPMYSLYRSGKKRTFWCLCRGCLRRRRCYLLRTACACIACLLLPMRCSFFLPRRLDAPVTINHRTRTLAPPSTFPFPCSDPKRANRGNIRQGHRVTKSQSICPPTTCFPRLRLSTSLSPSLTSGPT